MIHTEDSSEQLSLLRFKLDSMKYELYPSGSRYYEINTMDADYDFIMQEPETTVETWGIHFIDLGFWFIPLPPFEFSIKPSYLLRHALGVDIIVVRDAKTRWIIQQAIKRHNIFKRNIDFGIKQNRAFLLKFCIELLSSQ